MRMSNLVIEELNFIECKVTNTRLMGVVGVHSEWQDSLKNQIHVLFHLDFEDYGIDGYELLWNPSDDEINYEVQKMMGGLGGSMVSAGEEDVKALLDEAYAINEKRSEEMPKGVQIWVGWFRETVRRKELYNLICEPIKLNYQRIHYAIMRLVGMDQQGFNYVTDAHIPYEDYVEEPSLLLKNVIEELEQDSSEQHFLVTSLISSLGCYKIIHWYIAMGTENTFKEILYSDELVITGKEAALLLRRDEHLGLFKVLDNDYLETYFEEHKPELMCNEHAQGKLYTAFRSHNHHVKDQTFYLNGDIFAVYYLTQANELIISGFDESCYLRALDEFEKKPLEGVVELQGKYELNQSIIYEFVHSSTSKFKDFIENL